MHHHHHHRSTRSRPLYLPRFPRIQRMLRLREEDEALDAADTEYDAEIEAVVLH